MTTASQEVDEFNWLLNAYDKNADDVTTELSVNPRIVELRCPPSKSSW